MSTVNRRADITNQTSEGADDQAIVVGIGVLADVGGGVTRNDVAGCRTGDPCRSCSRVTCRGWGPVEDDVEIGGVGSAMAVQNRVGEDIMQVRANQPGQV